jgi:hypothetical protein
MPSAPHGLPRGTRLRARHLGARVFADRRHGFALATTRDGATYPAASLDGGRTWRVDGPVFHVPAAQGPLAVDQAGVASRNLYFAWGAAEDTVVDVTADAGRHWRQVFLPATVVAVTANLGRPGGLTALVFGGRGGSLWIYRTADGRRWRLDGSLRPG